MFNNGKTNEKIEASNSSNILGKGTFLSGDLEAYGNIRIEGKLIGSVKTKSKVSIGQSSSVEGNVLSQNADIEGEVTGNIEVAELLVLKSTAKINGDIVTNKLMIEPGAIFNGKCQMGSAKKEIKLQENGSHQVKKPFNKEKLGVPV